MTLRARKLMMLCLILAFGFQTYLVYSDQIGRSMPALSEDAARGREVWHENNCQSCHQLYGFGGFLGPDLTNAHGRLTTARLDSILTVGARSMPAFELDDEERAALTAFLAEVDATGVGQLPPKSTFDADAVLIAAVEGAAKDDALDVAEQRGMAIVLEQKCITCHLPNPRTEQRGTDLTTLVGKLGAGGVQGIVTSGIASKGMPAFTMEKEDLDALVAFLGWMAEHGEVVQGTFASSSAKAGTSDGLPWFEYAEE